MAIVQGCPKQGLETLSTLWKDIRELHKNIKSWRSEPNHLKGWQRIHTDAIEETPKEYELMILTTQEAVESKKDRR